MLIVGECLIAGGRAIARNRDPVNLIRGCLKSIDQLEEHGDRSAACASRAHGDRHR
jgi:hypothetical protein